ncbi:peptide ABC transporter permease [Wenjunlia vitaminophila]|uniref:Peptide ABC transporter permease n=1 Tax=Wenjunlia vitaminophila TaxID=76728 RepID=A0A0T6LW66_WENVI|nr:ABC transporter permease [Wenjunlia vitaminophila]KRV50248.1 peptide ABC transporter permease [Wenjunlia vitaminophila]
MSKQSGGLGRYVAQRLLLAVPMVLILLTLVFLLMRVAPGDPVSAAAGGKLGPEQLAEKRRIAGLDKPLFEQYLDYLGDVVTLDFGTTFVDHRKVSDIIIENGGATLSLTLGALFVAVLIGLPIGLFSGRYRDSAFDVTARIFGITTYAAPVFFTGLLAQLAFSGTWLPTSDQADPLTSLNIESVTHIYVLDCLIAGDWNAVEDGLKHLILPSITLGLLIVGVFIRMIRINVIQSLHGDYIEAARARGVRERRVVTQHAFRNALVPVITVLGLQVALLLGGAVLTEKTFNWPGVGSTLITYINQRDYIAVQGIVTVFALVVVLISMLIDFVNALIDPRVRY